MTSRLPTGLEVSALIRQVSGEGGFATVLAKGEPDSGAIMLVLIENGVNSRVYERMPQADGSRTWHLSRRDNPEDPTALPAYLERRREQDRDLWIVELDIARGERFIGLTIGEH